MWRKQDSLDALAVDNRSVRRTKVAYGYTVGRKPNLGVTARHVGVGHHDGTLGGPADELGRLGEGIARARGRNQAGLGATSDEVDSNTDLAECQRSVFENLYRKRTNEVIALLEGVFASRGRQFVNGGLLKSAKARSVFGREIDPDLVWSHGAAGTHSGREVELSSNSLGDFDGLDVGLEALGKRAIKQSLEPTLYVLQCHT